MAGALSLSPGFGERVGRRRSAFISDAGPRTYAHG